ncbi:hypothetical protein T440DRAFT_464133 [Plenodomus tracheiphilus IPT5]|uniref:Sensitive to high expression protein 9, mitochondrial n=1 Tax=Plenodomus tracheiphilus IPT5 TaxID=1408161 RepID=A0A6A7BML8_9PLEO|nr:hypothetical protein T440DRAFT_464133 [Plenodomus tracheiphilus IPT5]
MRPLLQHASRSLAPLVAPSRAGGSFAPAICWRCQYRRGDRKPLNSSISEQWSQRTFSSSRRWMEDRKPDDPSRPISMPPPSSEAQNSRDNRAAFTDSPSLQERQERLQREFDAIQKQAEEQKVRERAQKLRQEEEARQAEERAREQHRLQQQEQARAQVQANNTPKKDEVDDNIARVPDEHLPSHRERQRWSLSKRLSDAMDDLLPKLALVTQKVNTYTGTDYSGVQALRREIQEQEQLVRARRLAIDTKKQALDTALSHQAASQKEVVALLERKHSWSSSDLERYMSLIRSEHLNDLAVRESKDAVAAAETALEEARAQLEKRERAQYHEEQIWSDTIRRNSTWVTFGLMGVNIFLLLLSLAVLEPWRRRRMVREIKTALEAQILAMEMGTSEAAVVAAQEVRPDSEPVADTPTATTSPVNKAGETARPVPHAAPAVVVKEPESATLVDSVEPTATPLLPQETQGTSQETLHTADKLYSEPDTRSIFQRWQQNATAAAVDVVSDRVISIRRIDYTAAVLQGAAAGAVITAAIIAMLRPN